MAVTIVLEISSDASGVNAPSVSRAPPPASAQPAARGVALARAQPEVLEEAAGALDAVAAEPAEQLLRAVPDEQRSHDAAQEKSSEIHVASR